MSFDVAPERLFMSPHLLQPASPTRFEKSLDGK